MTRSSWLCAALASTIACGKGAHKGPPDAGVAVSASTQLGGVPRAEDQRRAKDVPESASTSHDPSARRRAAMALARIADPASEDALLRALSDEDEPTAAWGAYGLGWTCKGREEPHVRALAARAASLSAGASDLARDVVDPRMAIARAVGRCSGPLAEHVLTAWVRGRGPWAVRAAYALGDVAMHSGRLEDATQTALLEVAEPANDAAIGIDAALYPFSRLERVSDSFAPRVIAAARAAFAHATPERAFAIRALGRTTRDAALDLQRAVENQDFSSAERAEAARALGLLGDGGHTAAAAALARLVPDKDPLAIAALGGDAFGPLHALVASVGEDPPPGSGPGLYALANLRPPGDVPAPLERRLDELRCGAAAILARGSFDADVLRQCADPASPAAERARLTSILRRPIVGERRNAFRALARSPHLAVREAAVAGISQHPELADAALRLLADALASDEPGLVATAAEVLHAHPERVLTLAASERKAALDPNAPPPSANPAREVDPAVASALKGALERAWTEDLVETRSALLEASVAVRSPAAHGAAERACHDPNVTIREQGAKALRALGDPTPICPAPDPSPDMPVPALATTDTKVIFSTDAGDLGITFEAALAPVAVARFVALAKDGFYKNVVVHRVVHGFVAQFGDPHGDGYGGSGKLLRCETSPVPFGRLDVGVALSGRDTGSSQLFVTLGRFPHLDGEYARVGRADGDWDALTEGDLIHDVKVEEPAPAP